MLELLGMPSTHSLPSLPGPLWPGVVDWWVDCLTAYQPILSHSTLNQALKNRATSS